MQRLCLITMVFWGMAGCTDTIGEAPSYELDAGVSDWQGADAAEPGWQGYDAGEWDETGDAGLREETLETGVFLGISGLEYATDTLRGTTNAKGQFQYLPGQSVEFFVGDVSLGRGPARAQMDVFDLAGLATPPVGEATIKKMLRNPAFRHVVNLAVFLTTFDDNGRPGDGIVIVPEVSALFAGVQLDFRLPIQRFPNGPFTRALIAAQDLFSVPHGAISAPRAMQSLYAALDIDAKLVVPTKTTVTDSLRPGWWYISKQTYSASGYMQNGVVTSSDSDSPRIVTNNYDENGNRLAWTIKSSAGHTSSGRATYDIHNNRITGFNSYQQSETTWRYTYDNRGFLVSVAADTDSDGISDRIVEQVYNGRNELQEQRSRGKNGAVSSVQFGYDDRHNLTKQKSNQTEWNWTYDTANNPLKVVRFQLPKTSPLIGARSKTTQYNEHGNPIKIQLRDTTESSFTMTLSYDENNRLAHKDTQFVTGESTTAIYTHDEHGNVVKVVFRTSSDGGIRTTEYEVTPTGWGVLDLEFKLDTWMLSGMAI